jgi:hypothetical protein
LPELVGRLRRLVELAYDFVGSSNLTDIMENKKGPENQVPFYLARLGEASVVRKTTLCASRTPAGYACGPGENLSFQKFTQPPGAIQQKARLRGL